MRVRTHLLHFLYLSYNFYKKHFFKAFLLKKINKKQMIIKKIKFIGR